MRRVRGQTPESVLHCRIPKSIVFEVRQGSPEQHVSRAREPRTSELNTRPVLEVRGSLLMHKTALPMQLLVSSIRVERGKLCSQSPRLQRTRIADSYAMPWCEARGHALQTGVDD
jgi:hypothetical protein